MPADTDHLLFLSDAIDRTLVNPGASHCWNNLIQLSRNIKEAAVLQQVVASITNRVPDEGIAGFYRAMFLDIATGDLRYAGRAATILTDLAPRDQDRMAAFLQNALQRALLYANDRPAYIDNLRTIGLPALCTLIGGADDLESARRAPSVPDSVRRVALIAPQLVSARHPPTRMLLDQTEVLFRNGITVSIFSCQEAMVPDSTLLLGKGRANDTQETELAAWLATRQSDITIYSSNHKLSLARRWQGMLPQIDAFAPDLVLFVGLHSGLINTLYRRYPVLGLATNSVPPLVATDVWLTAQTNLNGTVSDPWQAGLPASQAFYHPFRAHRRACAGALDRASFGIPSEAVVMISVGTHLHIKIDSHWASHMEQVMRIHPTLHWLLLGGEGHLPPALAALDAKRLHCLPQTTQAMELMAMCDIYVNPPMMGGGMAVSEAMSLGLPVLSLADCDGGDKLGDAAVNDIDAYFARLDRWAGDAAQRTEAGAGMRAHFERAINLAASGPSLLAACDLALRRFKQRIAAQPASDS